MVTVLREAFNNKISLKSVRRRRGGGDGGAAAAPARAAAPRRPRAAGISDAFPRPHANVQLFIVNRVFECLIDELLVI